MADGVNAQIADALTARLLQVGRVTTGLCLEVWSQLAALESTILAILKMSDPTEETLLRVRRRMVEEVMDEDLVPLITRRYSTLAALMTTDLLRLARQEAGVMQEIVNTATGAQTLPDAPTAAALRRGVTESLIPTPQRPTDLSATGAEWWVRQGESLSQHLRDSLLVGVSLEESLRQLTGRIRGTSDNGFEDGLMARARTDAATLVQTQVTNAVSTAHEAIGQRNASPALVAMHSSILDSRTSTVCLARHGLRYTVPDYEPLGHAIPYLGGPPYHPSCRSTIVIGLRDGGPLPQASVTQWLQRRDSAFQDEVLGPTRAKMFRAGTLTPRQLLEGVSGKPLTLEELGA